MKTLLLVFAFCLIPFSSGAAPTPTSQVLAQEIQSAGKNPGSPERLIQTWKTRYGTQAVPALVELSRNTAQEDQSRFLALIGIARLGGLASEPWITSQLKDRSWMVRIGALRSLSIIRSKKAETLGWDLIQKDPSDLVRVEALRLAMNSSGPQADRALRFALLDSKNYRKGYPLTLPQAGLEIVQQLRLSLAIPHLKEIQKLKSANPKWKAEVQKTLAILSSQAH